MATRILVPKTVGGGLPRIDGPLKVSGTAKYASDHHFPGMLYAVPVCSTIAKGKITTLDTSAAEKMPGVEAVFHRANIGRLYRAAPVTGITGFLDERRPPFEDDVIRYYGQYVAVVVAETFEQAQAAAYAVKVTYSAENPAIATHLETEDEAKVVSSRGKPEDAFKAAPVKVDETYSTPTETHNPIELHSIVALWDGQAFTLYESTQGVVNQRVVMAQMLGVAPENVRVISRFLGSGFGGKLWVWPHSVMAAAAARNLNRPVKLVISRPMMFQNVGHRPQTQQRIRLGATAEGKLVSLEQDYLNHTSILDDYDEGCGEATPYLYSTPNLRVTSGLARLNVGTPTAMRGPGAVPGLFGVESAMDELAVKLKMDPLELRLKNEPEKDESNGLPFSSRHLTECFKVGAEKFGWSQRTPGIGSMKKDGLTLGWGVAACSWGAGRFAASATVDLKSDGTARVSCATQDIETGTYTILAQVLSEKTGIPLDRIEVVLGDSSLPDGPISGGSLVTSSVIPAISQAVQSATQTIFMMATDGEQAAFPGKKPDDLAFAQARVHLKEKAPDTGVAWHEILQKGNVNAASGSGKAEEYFGGPEAKDKYSVHSFGAQFAEVTWQPEIARLRVSRVVSVIDSGRIMNPQPARNQIEGAVVMGVGMALLEETKYEPRSGAPINNNLADYMVATNADAPLIDVTFLDYPDKVVNEFGARGVGEIGLAGTAAAITSAVYHATGVRVRSLPVRIEDLIGRPAGGNLRT
ncbi:MAG: xanthine dehydrogenase family protein molybdopterin-binding subunit [Acidobacteriaceae bacterium]|nr:xanthine dehydrogenase family protein molybdopterin-binding subunit [Acidobacteriaceae bacterium]